MDIFRFHTQFEQGEIINGIKSKMWVERYREAGEFEFVADVSSGIREKLPIGSYVSHIDTGEVMIVETHSISESQGKTSDIVVSGRGFETILDQRVVGANINVPRVGIIEDYVLAPDYVWTQAVRLIDDHILVSGLVDPYDALPGVSALHLISETGPQIAKSIPRGPLHTRLLELLELDNLGIKALRPGVFSPFSSSQNLNLVVHRGVDRTKEVMFSHDSGEIESADYLWSNKLLKNSALVSSRWVEIRIVDLTNTVSYRRMMHVDAKDIDEHFETPPTGADLDAVIEKMQERGKAVIAAQRNIALAKTEVTKEGTRSRYRVDYNVGDLITVHGDYHESTIRRVTEYVEIEDETGMKSYPTLTVDE